MAFCPFVKVEVVSRHILGEKCVPLGFIVPFFVVPTRYDYPGFLQVVQDTPYLLQCPVLELQGKCLQGVVRPRSPVVKMASVGLVLLNPKYQVVEHNRLLYPKGFGC